MLKQLALRWQKVFGVIKVVVYYPGDVVREKKKDFPGAANALIALLACFYIAVFIFYFNFGLSGYLLAWSGVVDRIEYKVVLPNQRGRPVLPGRAGNLLKKGNAS